MALPRLLVVVNVFEPDLGGGVLFADLCYGLAARGFEVTVRCAYPYYPEWRDKTGENGLRVKRYVHRGVLVERHGIYIPRNPNALSERMAYEASFAASLLRRIPARHEFDAMMVFCPLIGGVAYGAFCRRLTGIPMWLNVQDLAAEAAAAGGIGRGEWMVRLQESLFNRADVWSSISPAMVERLAPRRRRHQPLLYVPNWLHESLRDHLASLPEKHRTVPSSPVQLLYSGNLGTKQNLIALCRLLHASDAGFSFRIRAAGGGFAELRDWAASAGDDRFDVGGLTAEAELAGALRDADFFVITERHETGGSFLPSKLIAALAAGTPVLAVGHPDSPLGREMAEHRPGPHFSWADAAKVPALLSSIDPARYGSWQANAAERADFFNRDRVIDEYARALRKLIEGREFDLTDAA